MEFIGWLHEASHASCWGEGGCDEGTDENAAVEALVKHSLPEGVTFKVAEGDRVILKAWSKKRSADNTSYVPRQITIKRSNYEDDSEMMMALDMSANILLKQVAALDAGMDVDTAEEADD